MEDDLPTEYDVIVVGTGTYDAALLSYGACYLWMHCRFTELAAGCCCGVSFCSPCGSLKMSRAQHWRVSSSALALDHLACRKENNWILPDVAVLSFFSDGCGYEVFWKARLGVLTTCYRTTASRYRFL